MSRCRCRRGSATNDTPIFFDLVQAAGGSFRFDLATYRQFDLANRRLFLLLSKILSRRQTSPRFELRHLAVNVLGFASTIATRDLKVKVWRCVERLTELQVVKPLDKESLFSITKRGEYVMVLERGDYFTKRRTADTRPTVSETAIHDLLCGLGFNDHGICRLVRRFPMPMLREWTDITQTAKERFGASFFKKSPQAFLVDNLKNAANGTRTPPDWWHAVRRAEARIHPAPQRARAEMKPSAVTERSDEAHQAYERIAKEMFAVFRAGGQPESAASVNAEKFSREYTKRGMPDLGLPFLRLLKG